MSNPITVRPAVPADGRLDWWVLDWNEPAIGFYRSIGAEAMAEWTVYRLSGQSPADLAGK